MSRLVRNSNSLRIEHISSMRNAWRMISEKGLVAEVMVRGWMEYRFVMQDHKDPRAFTIVERYAHESSQK
jgi:hypothetical protein